MSLYTNENIKPTIVVADITALHNQSTLVQYYSLLTFSTTNKKKKGEAGNYFKSVQLTISNNHLTLSLHFAGIKFLSYKLHTTDIFTHSQCTVSNGFVCHTTIRTLLILHCTCKSANLSVHSPFSPSY